MSLRVKICGITNADDAQAAVDAGADALGFVFCDSSPRYLSPAAAGKICSVLPPFVTTVGLFVNSTEASIREALDLCRIDAVQLHGDESPEFCSRIRRPVIKGFRIQDENSLKDLPAYFMTTWLLDSYVPGQLGGTGQRFSWELACRARQLGSRIVLAGGLTPDNVAAAVLQVQPYAVDVSSGVESSPGKKDFRKVQDFIQAAKTAGQTSPRSGQ